MFLFEESKFLKEFMGKQNVQNLISFYLNADMYRQYARKELIRNSKESTNPSKLTLEETKKGSVLLFPSKICF